MTLRLLMTVTASTQHRLISSGKSGSLTTHLENVKVTPPQLPSAEGRQRVVEAVGMEGTSIIVYECYTEKHSHTDDSVTVNQIPDINHHDKIIIGGVTYTVQFAEPNPATLSTNESMKILMVKDKRK